MLFNKMNILLIITSIILITSGVLLTVVSGEGNFNFKDDSVSFLSLIFDVSDKCTEKIQPLVHKADVCLQQRWGSIDWDVKGVIPKDINKEYCCLRHEFNCIVDKVIQKECSKEDNNDFAAENKFWSQKTNEEICSKKGISISDVKCKSLKPKDVGDNGCKQYIPCTKLTDTKIQSRSGENSGDDSTGGGTGGDSGGSSGGGRRGHSFAGQSTYIVNDSIIDSTTDYRLISCQLICGDRDRGGE
ncbi:uncharacterized protein LOC128955997 [Oppia nitens]|uniref:uncharacterized protein LOC128955997 n=1 Tax=Oppia nitens TaxID=1686743 RepID=UPI0023DABE27|nr:uncharacterized protein LOC128955997 [Oppia nitens]